MGEPFWSPFDGDPRAETCDDTHQEGHELRWCIRRPGHRDEHRDERGHTWGEES